MTIAERDLFFRAAELDTQTEPDVTPLTQGAKCLNLFRDVGSLDGSMLKLGTAGRAQADDVTGTVDPAAKRAPTAGASRQ